MSTLSALLNRVLLSFIPPTQVDFSEPREKNTFNHTLVSEFGAHKKLCVVVRHKDTNGHSS